MKIWWGDGDSIHISLKDLPMKVRSCPVYHWGRWCTWRAWRNCWGTPTQSQGFCFCGWDSGWRHFSMENWIPSGVLSSCNGYPKCSLWGVVMWAFVSKKKDMFHESKKGPISGLHFWKEILVVTYCYYWPHAQYHFKIHLNTRLIHIGHPSLVGVIGQHADLFLTWT